ncbi:MAG: hypothetical protein U0174_01025 [Polyangiaceae bacterium]
MKNIASYATAGIAFSFGLLASRSALAEQPPVATSPVSQAEPGAPDRTGLLHGGISVRFGQTSAFGLAMGYQHRIPLAGDDHALVLGPRLAISFPSLIGPELAPGGEIGYRGNFVHGEAFRAGPLVLVQPALNMWLGGTTTVTAITLPAVAGGFLKYGPFEAQATIGGGPLIGLGVVGSGGFGVFNLTGGLAF